jgi:hypothetical protein
MHVKGGCRCCFASRYRRDANTATVARHVASFAPGRAYLPSASATTSVAGCPTSVASFRNGGGLFNGMPACALIWIAGPGAFISPNPVGPILGRDVIRSEHPGAPTICLA